MQFRDLFQSKKPIIGMIHLAGRDKEERMQRALEELQLYQEEGVDGAIIGSYFKTLATTQMPVQRESKKTS